MSPPIDLTLSYVFTIEATVLRGVDTKQLGDRIQQTLDEYAAVQPWIVNFKVWRPEVADSKQLLQLASNVVEAWGRSEENLTIPETRTFLKKVANQIRPLRNFIDSTS